MRPSEDFRRKDPPDEVWGEAAAGVQIPAGAYFGLWSEDYSKTIYATFIYYHSSPPYMDDDISSKTRNVGPSFFEGFFSDPKDSYTTEISKRGSFLIDQRIVTGYGTTARGAEADARLKYESHKEHQSYLAQKRAENERLDSLRSGSSSGFYHPHNSATAGEWILRAILILGLFGVTKCTRWCMRTEIEATFGPNSHHLDHWLYK